MVLSDKKIGFTMTIKIIILILILFIFTIDSLFIEPNMLRVKKYTLHDKYLKGIKIIAKKVEKPSGNRCKMYF